MSRNRAFDTRFLLYFLFVLILVIITSGKATADASDRPTSSITSTDPYWFRTDDSTGSLEIEWEVSDPYDNEIKWIYFWACYYYDVVESCDGKEKDNWTYIQRHAIIEDDPKMEVISIDDLIAKVGDEEGYYKLITCAVNEDGIAGSLVLPFPCVNAGVDMNCLHLYLQIVAIVPIYLGPHYLKILFLLGQNYR